MTEIKAKITALSPVFVGGDVAGTIRLPYMIHAPHDKKKYKIDREKLEQFIKCVGSFYRDCDKSKFGRRSFTEAFRDRVYAALCCNSVNQFFTSLLRKLPLSSDSVYQYIVKFTMGLNEAENRFLLQWGRENIDIFVASAVYMVDSFKFREDFHIDESNLEMESDYIVPVIPGNTIRGRMRDLLMAYAIDKIFGENPHKCLRAKQYHTLFSGGMLTDDTGFVNIESKRDFRERLPFLSILGCMKGNEDVPGKIHINFAKLNCHEFNPENERSGFSYLKEYFCTRRDDYEGIVSEEELKKLGGAVQMIYSMMCIETGSEFFWSIEYDQLTDIEHSFFDLMLSLFITNGNVGGIGRVGFGKISVELEDYILNPALTDQFLSDNRENIKEMIEKL